MRCGLLLDLYYRKDTRYKRERQGKRKSRVLDANCVQAQPASVQVCGYHNTKGINVLSRLQLRIGVTERHFTFGKRFAESPALVYVPADFDTIEKAAEKGLK